MQANAKGPVLIALGTTMLAMSLGLGMAHAQQMGGQQGNRQGGPGQMGGMMRPGPGMMAGGAIAVDGSHVYVFHGGMLHRVEKGNVPTVRADELGRWMGGNRRGDDWNDDSGWTGGRRNQGGNRGGMGDGNRNPSSALGE